MKIMKNIIFTIFLCAIALPVVAGRNDNAMKANWGNANMMHCGAQNLKDACVGNSLAGCGNWNAGTRSPNRGTHDDEMATLLLLARDINANGAKFCVTQAQGANKNKGNAWTVFFNPAGDAINCFWLCKPGFSGDGCAAAPAVPTMCDSVPLTRAQFSDYKISHAGSSVEDEVVMFHWSEDNPCGVNKKQEHDMVLGISDWLPSGHGAIARSMIVRAERNGWDDMISTATIWGVGAETLLCKTGYKANSAKTDCEPIDAALCNLNALCSGWSRGTFNEAVHKMVAVGNCFEFRCSAPGTAFKSDSDRTCVECSGGKRIGVATGSGICITCPEGKNYDKDASKNGYCRDTTKYSTNDLSYGPGKDKNTELMEQCWTMLDVTAYMACVTKSTPPSSSNPPSPPVIAQTTAPTTVLQSGQGIQNVVQSVQQMAIPSKYQQVIQSVQQVATPSSRNETR